MTTPPDSADALAQTVEDGLDDGQAMYAIHTGYTSPKIIAANAALADYRRQVVELAVERDRLRAFVERVAEWETDNVGLTYYETKEYGKDARELLESENAPPTAPDGA